MFFVYLVSIIFSHSAGSLFVLLIGLFSVENLINPNVATLVKVFFCCLCLRRHRKKMEKTNVKEYTILVFPMSFVVSDFNICL